MITMEEKSLKMQQMDGGWSVFVSFHHAGLSQSILHHQHIWQAQSCTSLQLLVGDFQGGGRHPGQRLKEEDHTTSYE